MEQEFLHQGINQARNANYKMAIALFDRAIASSSRVSQAYYHRGLAYYDWGNIDRAIADYDRSLNLNPQQVEVYFSTPRRK